MRRYVKYLLAGSTLLITGWLIVLQAQFTRSATNRWTPSAELAVAREAACSVLLPDGRMMVAGGYGQSGAWSCMARTALLH